MILSEKSEARCQYGTAKEEVNRPLTPRLNPPGMLLKIEAIDLISAWEPVLKSGITRAGMDSNNILFFKEGRLGRVAKALTTDSTD